MKNGSKSVEEIASDKINKVLGEKIVVNSWIMSEITEENPDWHEKDEKLSLILVQLFSNLTKKMYINNVSVSIGDRSGEETTPHYAIDIQIGKGNSNRSQSTEFFVEYLSKIEGEEHPGDMRVTANFEGTNEEHTLLTKTLFEKYCILLEKYYPEFKTLFKNGNGEYVSYKKLGRCKGKIK